MNKIERNISPSNNADAPNGNANSRPESEMDEKMKLFMKMHEELMQENRKTIESNKKLEEKVKVLDQELGHVKGWIDTFKSETVLTTVGLGTKLYVKLGSFKEICFTVGKFGTLETGKEISKLAVRWIPTISLVVGIGFAAYRINRKEYIRAALEIISGALPLLTGPGIPISVIMDSAIAYKDYKTNGPQVEKEKIDLKTAFNELGIEVSNPSQAEIDRCYKLCIANAHTDLVDGKHCEISNSNHCIVKYSKEAYEDECKYLGQCKDVIYTANGWSK